MGWGASLRARRRIGGTQPKNEKLHRHELIMPVITFTPHPSARGATRPTSNSLGNTPFRRCHPAPGLQPGTSRPSMTP